MTQYTSRAQLKEKARDQMAGHYGNAILLSIPAGALGILFAMLTRKKGQRMSSMCVAGIWLSCVGLALGIFITISSIVTVFTDPSYRNMLDQMYQQMYGVDMEEFWQSYL